jgi:hypothetical protein
MSDKFRYSDIVENQRVISYQIKNSQVVTNVQHLNFIPNIGKIFVIFIELYKKWTFVHIKGKKLLQKPGEKKLHIYLFIIIIIYVILVWPLIHLVYSIHNNPSIVAYLIFMSYFNYKTRHK